MAPAANAPTTAQTQPGTPDSAVVDPAAALILVAALLGLPAVGAVSEEVPAALGTAVDDVAVDDVTVEVVETPEAW
jgi:hypothetical protein